MIFNGGNASKEINKSKGQLLKESQKREGVLNQKIADLERERKWLSERTAYLVVAVNALGRHAKLEPLECKAVIDAYIKEQEIELNSQADVAKQKFVDDLKAGKAPEFKVVAREDLEKPQA